MHSILEIHAATPRLYFQLLYQHEVLQVISTLNAGFARIMLTMAT